MLIIDEISAVVGSNLLIHKRLLQIMGVSNDVTFRNVSILAESLSVTTCMPETIVYYIYLVMAMPNFVALGLFGKWISKCMNQPR